MSVNWQLPHIVNRKDCKNGVKVEIILLGNILENNSLLMLK